MVILPIPLNNANLFVKAFHRHHDKVVGHKASFGLYAEEPLPLNPSKLVGVAIVGRPLARKIDHSIYCEVVRCCVLPNIKNGCSMLYGHCKRWAKANGYRKVITYTLASEPGTSLRASGFTKISLVKGASWSHPSRKNERYDRGKGIIQDKIKWEIELKPLPKKSTRRLNPMGFWYTDSEDKLAKDVQREATKRERVITTTNQLRSIGAKGCAACPLDKAKLHHGKMLPTGSKRPLVYILGEAPGAAEDEQGEQFVDKAGKTLRNEIPDKYLNKVRWNNTIRCRPTEGKVNRAPDPIELECCRGLQAKDIEETKPRAIFGFGDVPLKWVAQKPGLALTSWRGRRFPVQFGSHSCWYYPMLHPSYINRVLEIKEHKGPEIAQVFKWDLERAFAEVFDGELPEPNVEQKEERLKGIASLFRPDRKTLTGIFKEMSSWEEMGFDIETNALRPYFPERRILSLSFSNYTYTYAFPYAHPECNWGKDAKWLRGAVREFLLHSGRKWAHNLNFEMEWCAEEFGEDVLRETEWGDTMAQAYVLDEREGAKALGDLTLLHMGFDVKAESSINTKNMMAEPLSKILPYNGMDAKYCYALSMIQGQLLEADGLQEVYEEQARRSPTLVMTQRIGLVPNEPEVKRLEAEWTKKGEVAVKKLMAHPDEIAYMAKGHKFVPTAPADVGRFLQSKFPGRVDNSQEETLSALKYAPANAVLEMRRANKLLSTYLTPYRQGGKAVHPDGLVHTSYNHCKVATRRLSSEDPNVQNVERRKTPEARIIIASPSGKWMLKPDYGQLEARVIAMASKDKNLVAQTWAGKDIHGVWTLRLGKKLNKEGVERDAESRTGAFKDYRDRIKNEWTFPLFFGASATNIARSLEPVPGITWEMNNKGYPSALPWFRDTVDAFWSEYLGVKQWQEYVREFYGEHGYVELLTGFRRHGPLSWNEIINTPIQGSACDIVMDGMNRLSEKAYVEDRPEFQPVLNCHDELDAYLPDDDRLEETVKEYACQMCMCEFDWINVPLVVEISIGKDWYNQEDVGVYSSKDWGHTEKVSISAALKRRK